MDEGSSFIRAVARNLLEKGVSGLFLRFFGIIQNLFDVVANVSKENFIKRRIEKRIEIC